MSLHTLLRRSSLVFVTALLLTLLTPATGLAQQLSRAQAVAQAVGVNPEVKLSLAAVAQMEGRITEARADALPDVTWTTRAIRSRDPGLLNSPNFDQFPIEFRSALAPIPGNMFDTFADVQQTLFSFKLGNAIKAATLARDAGQVDVRRARQVTALSAVQSYNQLLFAIEQLRVARSTIDQKQGHVDVARNRRAAGAATELEVLRAEVDLENQRAELSRAETLVSAARARLNTVMLRPTDTPIEPTDVLAAVPVATTFEQAVREALMARPELRDSSARGADPRPVDRRDPCRHPAKRRLHRRLRIVRSQTNQFRRLQFRALVGRGSNSRCRCSMDIGPPGASRRVRPSATWSPSGSPCSKIRFGSTSSRRGTR